MPLTPESAHEPTVVRAPSIAPKKDQHVTSLVKKQTRVTPRAVLRFLVEIALVVTLPFMIATVVGLVMMAFPQVSPSGVTPADAGLPYVDVKLTTFDGLSLSAWDVAATSPSANGSAIIILPGNGMDKGGIFARTSFLAADYRLLYVDFRSVGGSDGKFSTLGLREKADVAAAAAYLRSQGVSRIGVYGFVMGGAAALRAAADDADIDAVVTEDAYGSYMLAAQEPYRLVGPLRPIFAWWARLGVRWTLGLDIAAESPSAVASRIVAPVLVVHSQTSGAVPVIHAELLRTSLSGNAESEFWVHDGSTDIAARTEFAQRVATFFMKHLAP